MTIIRIGLDTAKHVFQVHCVDEREEPVLRRRLGRTAVEPFFAKLPPTRVGLEACGAAHYWARVLQGLGHEVVLLPPHNLPFRGVHTRIGELAAHHHARCAEVIAACARPHSAAELMPVLFNRVLDRHQTGFALGEALAHLHYLVSEGEVARATGDDGVNRFLRKAA